MRVRTCAGPAKIAAAVSLFLLFLIIAFPGPARGAESSGVTPEVESLIKPYRPGEEFQAGWKFLKFEMASRTDVVVSLAGPKDGRKMFLWLLAKDDTLGRTGQSKNFNIICALEGGGEAGPEEKEIMDRLVDLIKGNDRGQVSLAPKPADDLGKVGVVLEDAEEVGKTKPGSRKFWVSIIIFAALIVMAIIIRRRTAAGKK